MPARERASPAPSELGIVLDTSQTRRRQPGQHCRIAERERLDARSDGECDRASRRATAACRQRDRRPRRRSADDRFQTSPGKHYQRRSTRLKSAGLPCSGPVRTLQSTATTERSSAQDPAPASQLRAGSPVTLTLSVPGEVPDTDGMTVDERRRRSPPTVMRLRAGNTTTTAGAGGKVIGTDPTAGTDARPGSSVTLIVNGAAPVSKQHRAHPGHRSGAAHDRVRRHRGRRSGVRLIEAGVVAPKVRASLEQRLRELHAGIVEVIAQTRAGDRS